ncbi:MAG: GNAT family N-acetyltransferase [Anaerostipes sp.]|nr:GNAT family N-acetyltransferase [Anaerostipes sp.]
MPDVLQSSHDCFYHLCHGDAASANFAAGDLFKEQGISFTMAMVYAVCKCANGYVTEAMNAVMKYAVEKMKIREISTVYAKENPASGHVLQKLGFQVVKEVPYECNGGEIVTTGRLCRYKV